MLGNSRSCCIGSAMVLRLKKRPKYDFYCFICPKCRNLIEVAVVHCNGEKITYSSADNGLPIHIVNILDKSSKDNSIICSRCFCCIKLTINLTASVVNYRKQ